MAKGQQRSTKEKKKPKAERNIKKGLVTREAFDKHLSALPDVADAAETIKARLGEDEEPERRIRVAELKRNHRL